MWIVTKTGFVSLVAHKSRGDMVRARARRREHLTDTFGEDDIEVIDLGPNAPDYRWHADVDVSLAADAIARAVETIDYDSHAKEAMSGDDRTMYRALLKVWSDLYVLQDSDADDDERGVFPLRWQGPLHAERQQEQEAIDGCCECGEVGHGCNDCPTFMDGGDGDAS